MNKFRHVHKFAIAIIDNVSTCKYYVLTGFCKFHETVKTISCSSGRTIFNNNVLSALPTCIITIVHPLCKELITINNFISPQQSPVVNFCNPLPSESTCYLSDIHSSGNGFTFFPGNDAPIGNPIRYSASFGIGRPKISL